LILRSCLICPNAADDTIRTKSVVCKKRHNSWQFIEVLPLLYFSPQRRRGHKEKHGASH
jgi:hypothetical protein